MRLLINHKIQPQYNNPHPINTAPSFLSTHGSLRTQILHYAAFQFITTVCVNKRWRYISVWLYLKLQNVPRISTVHSLFLTVQTSRTPSPGVGRYVTCPLAGGVAIASGLNATWVSTMDKYRITMGLELSLALVASQGIMHLMDHRLCQ